MASPLFANFFDIARALGANPLHANPQDVAKFVLREFRRGGGSFNYNPAISCMPGLFSGEWTRDQAVDFCMLKGAPSGRKPNCDAIDAFAWYAEAQRSSCYRIPLSAVPIGRLRSGETVYMAIKAPLVRVRNGQVFVVVPGFRLGHRPVGVEMDVASSLALASFARDDFAEADSEYLDCSRGPSGERQLQVFHGRDRRLFTLDEVDHLLTTFVQGVEMAIKDGMPKTKPNFRGYHVFDPDQPRMF